MKRSYIILIGLLTFLISLVFDNLILRINNFNFENILNSSLLWGLFVVGIILFLFILYKKDEKILLLLSGLLMSSIITGILKFIIKRPRPFTELTDIILKTGYSFPSGHATIAFAALPFLEEFSKFKWIWLIFIVIIILLRVYSGVHYLSDVIFGALIGYSVSSLVIYLNKKWKK